MFSHNVGNREDYEEIFLQKVGPQVLLVPTNNVALLPLILSCSPESITSRTLKDIPLIK